LQEEVDKLTPENAEMTVKLEAAAASQEAFRSQISALKEVNTSQQDGIESLREKLLEAQNKYDLLLADSKAEKATFQARVLDLEAERNELKEAVVEQQIKISRFERQNSSGISRPGDARQFRTSEARIPTSVIGRSISPSDDELSIRSVSPELSMGVNDKTPTTPNYPLSAPTRQPYVRPTPFPVNPEPKDSSTFGHRQNPVPTVAGECIRESVRIPTVVEDRQSTPAELAPDRKGNFREGFAEVPPTGTGRKGRGRRGRPVQQNVLPPTPLPEGGETALSSSLASIPIPSPREEDVPTPCPSPGLGRCARSTTARSRSVSPGPHLSAHQKPGVGVLSQSKPGVSGWLKSFTDDI